MKTRVYIDGANFYFGLLKNHPEYTNAADSFVLISGDSDFIAPLDLIRYELGKQVVVFNPKDRKSDLANHASYYRDIPRDLPAKCQLPDAIPVGTHGNFIRRPAAWK